MGYATDLTNLEWKIIEPLLPKKKATRPPLWSKRQILNGIFYQLKNGCNWGDFPKYFPPYSTVYWHYKQWRDQGVIDKIMTQLHQQIRWSLLRSPYSEVLSHSSVASSLKNS